MYVLQLVFTGFSWHASVLTVYLDKYQHPLDNYGTPLQLNSNNHISFFPLPDEDLICACSTTNLDDEQMTLVIKLYKPFLLPTNADAKES